VAIGILVVRFALVDRSLGPGILGSPATPPAAPSTLMPGDGFATPSVALTFWIVAILVVAVMAAAVRMVRKRHLPRWAEWIVVAVVTLVVLSALGRSTTGSALLDDGSFVPGPGWVESTSTTQGFNEVTRDGAFMTGPDGSFSFGIALRNDGSLPVTIHGLAKGPTTGGTTEDGYLGPTIDALGSLEPGQTWSGELVPGPEGVAPFTPVTLWPGQSVGLSVLGSGGPCAAPPGDAPWGASFGFPSIPLVLDVAGFGYVEEVPITEVAIAATDVCTSP
jgi:hypothetical protein